MVPSRCSVTCRRHPWPFCMTIRWALFCLAAAQVCLMEPLARALSLNLYLLASACAGARPAASSRGVPVRDGPGSDARAPRPAQLACLGGTAAARSHHSRAIAAVGTQPQGSPGPVQGVSGRRRPANSVDRWCTHAGHHCQQCIQQLTAWSKDPAHHSCGIYASDQRQPGRQHATAGGRKFGSACSWQRHHCRVSGAPCRRGCHIPCGRCPWPQWQSSSARPTQHPCQSCSPGSSHQAGKQCDVGCSRQRGCERGWISY